MSPVSLPPTMPAANALRGRVKRFAVSPAMILDLLVGMSDRPRTLSSYGLPADAKLVSSSLDYDTGLLHVVVASQSFPEVPDGHVLVEFQVTMTEHFLRPAERAEAAR